jgi:hypothetical protein
LLHLVDTDNSNEIDLCSLGIYASIQPNLTLNTITTFDGINIRVPDPDLSSMDTSSRGVVTIAHVNIDLAGGVYFTCFTDLEQHGTTAPGFAVPTFSPQPAQATSTGTPDNRAPNSEAAHSLGQGVTIGLFVIGATVVLAGMLLLLMRRRMAHQEVVRAVSFPVVYTCLAVDRLQLYTSLGFAYTVTS